MDEFTIDTVYAVSFIAVCAVAYIIRKLLIKAVQEEEQIIANEVVTAITEPKEVVVINPPVQVYVETPPIDASAILAHHSELALAQVISSPIVTLLLVFVTSGLFWTVAFNIIKPLGMELFLRKLFLRVPELWELPKSQLYLRHCFVFVNMYIYLKYSILLTSSILYGMADIMISWGHNFVIDIAANYYVDRIFQFLPDILNQVRIKIALTPHKSLLLIIKNKLKYIILGWLPSLVVVLSTAVGLQYLLWCYFVDGFLLY